MRANATEAKENKAQRTTAVPLSSVNLDGVSTANHSEIVIGDWLCMMGNLHA